MEFPATNFQQYPDAPVAPVVGDVFEAKVGVHRMIGRVMATDSVWDPAVKKTQGIVVFLFGPADKGWTPDDRALLQCSKALMGPIMVVSIPWTRRYFRTLANLEFAPGERPEKLVFKAGPVSRYRGGYIDEHYEPVEPGDNPVGRSGSVPYLMLDDILSERFGVPLAGD